MTGYSDIRPNEAPISTASALGGREDSSASRDHAHAVGVALEGGKPRLPRPGTRLRRVIEALPASNVDLAELLETHNGDVARTMARLRKRGLVRRVDGKTGRGSIALYGLTQGAQDALLQDAA